MNQRVKEDEVMIGSNDRVLRLAEVIQRTAISRSQIYHLMAIGRFPGKFALGPLGGAVGWLESEINQWLHERINDRNRKKSA